MPTIGKCSDLGIEYNRVVGMTPDQLARPHQTLTLSTRLHRPGPVGKALSDPNHSARPNQTWTACSDPTRSGLLDQTLPDLDWTTW